MGKSKDGNVYSGYRDDAARLAGELYGMGRRIDLIATSITNLSLEMEELKKIPDSQELMEGKIATMRELLRELGQLQKGDKVQQEVIKELKELHTRGIAALVNLDSRKDGAN